MTSSPADPLSPLHIPATPLVNRLLRTASWACERLRPFAGKTVRFNCTPFEITLTIKGDGTVADAAGDTMADAEFTLTPGLALRVLAADETSWHEIRISGDNALASATAHVARHLRWDVEEELSRVLGDVAAHRIAQTGGEVMRAQRRMVGDFWNALADYWSEERPPFAQRVEAEHFRHEVAALHDDVERLALRVDALSKNR